MGISFFFPPLRPPRPSGLLRLQPVCYSQASHHPTPGTKQHVHFITRLCSAQRDLLISVSAVFICDSARNVFTVHGALLDTACLHSNINIGSRGGGGSSSPLIPPSFIKMFIWKPAGPFIWLLLRAGSNNNSGSPCHTRQTKYTLDEGFQWPLDPSSAWHSTGWRALGGLPGPVMQLFIPNSTGSAPARACCYHWRCPQKPPIAGGASAVKGDFSRASPSSACGAVSCHPIPSHPIPRGVQDQAPSVPRAHLLIAARERGVTTNLLFLDPNSGMFWAQSGSSALLPLCPPHHPLPTCAPRLVPSASLWVCQPW